jgi:hypothetical protein
MSGGFCFYYIYILLCALTDPKSRRRSTSLARGRGRGVGPAVPGHGANKGCAAAVHVPLPRAPGQSAWPPEPALLHSSRTATATCQCVHACTATRSRVTDSRGGSRAPRLATDQSDRDQAAAAAAARRRMHACVRVPAQLCLRAAGQRGLRCARTTELARCGQLQPCGCSLHVAGLQLHAAALSVSFVYPALFLFKLRYIKL